jgi:CheY-like chemotaxis protein
MPGGGRLTISLADVVLDERHLRARVGARPGPHVELTVADTGEGMDEDTRARAFEPFFTTKPTGKGTGLGLSTVLGIAEQSGGHITLESEPGRGAKFRMYLPVTDERPPPPTAGAGEARAVERGRRSPASATILLVEDEGQLRVLARDILRNAGYEVLDAPNAAEAVRLSEMHAGPIHLLLTDVVMPHVGGRELARRLSIARPRMRLLYMSGYTSDSIVQQGAVEPGVGFLQKPITPDSLLEKVREALG